MVEDFILWLYTFLKSQWKQPVVYCLWTINRSLPIKSWKITIYVKISHKETNHLFILRRLELPRSKSFSKFLLFWVCGSPVQLSGLCPCWRQLRLLYRTYTEVWSREIRDWKGEPRQCALTPGLCSWPTVFLSGNFSAPFLSSLPFLPLH